MHLTPTVATVSPAFKIPPFSPPQIVRENYSLHKTQQRHPQMSHARVMSTSPTTEPFTFPIDGVDDVPPQLHLHSPLSAPPGDDSAHTTAPSFESILSGKSMAPFSRVAFAGFLRKIHCSENLEFLISSDNYLTCTTDATRKHLWHYIYTNFISTYALKEVNIPHDIRAQLNAHFDSDTLPQTDLVVSAMTVIKELLRDAYFQFIQSARRQCSNSPLFHDRANEDFTLLPSPMDECDCPGGTLGHCQLESSFPSTRCVSPLSVSDVTFVDVRQETIPRSSVAVAAEDVLYEYRDKKGSATSTKSESTKSSSLSESYGLKKFAGKFRWRRMSSNCSSSSQ